MGLFWQIELTKPFCNLSGKWVRFVDFPTKANGDDSPGTPGVTSDS